MEYPHRKKIRLDPKNYSQNGAYFITICTEKRKCILSRIVGDGVLDIPSAHLGFYGAVAEKRIQEMNQVYPSIQTVKYVIMPNHIHLLVCIEGEEDTTRQGTSRTPSPTNEIIPRYVSTFKRYCNRTFGTNIWQRSYHDRIIRDDAEYQMVWQYIDNNPALWELDCFYTEE